MRAVGLLLLMAFAACRAVDPAPPEAEQTTVLAPRAAAAKDGELASGIVPIPMNSASPAIGGAPVYPELSRRLHEEGTVELELEVLQSGELRSVEVARSSGHARLDEAALTAARTWRFNPRTGGDRVEVLRHRVVFRLLDA